MSSRDLALLEERIGYQFKDRSLLQQAVTHRSYLNEHPDWPVGHNERLEFLGDAVLELVVTEYLYEHYPSTPEGEMTNWRAALVNATMLSGITNDFDLNAHMLLSRGEARDTGRARQYILANAIEALIGAMYLDGGYQACKTFIGQFVLTHLPDIISKKLYRDPKSLLQEEAQERIGVTPTYQVMEEWGPDHARQFKIGVYLGRELAGEGQGQSKQDAQQAAAEDALSNKGWGGR
ncbi:MAG: ribonuclease III [Candidatus Yanofskybacteria bacterium]|nr:ribonuclease III [Candidatus Yanofskybacteria bacterium]